MKLFMLLMAFPVASQQMILVDFPGGMSQADGWKWEYFSDRLMGGRSDLVPPEAPISCSCGPRIPGYPGAATTRRYPMTRPRASFHFPYASR